MQRLKEKTILIGKEPSQGRLLIAMKLNGQYKVAALGAAGSVPNSVSRCNPAEEIAHCKIVTDANGSMTITNLKPQNMTYVNGSEILAKKITMESSVALGKDMFQIDLAAVMDAALKLVSSVPPPPVSIKHLETVWSEYESTNEAIAQRQQEKGRRRMLPMIIGSVSGLVAPLLAAVSSSSTLFVTAPISIISFVIYFKIYNEKDTTLEERKAAQDALIDNYVCPHEHCRHYVGQQPYKVLRQNKKCPYCGGGWIEK